MSLMKKGGASDIAPRVDGVVVGMVRDDDGNYAVAIQMEDEFVVLTPDEARELAASMGPMFRSAGFDDVDASLREFADKVEAITATIQ